MSKPESVFTATRPAARARQGTAEFAEVRA